MCFLEPAPPRRLGNFGKKAARVNRFSPKFDGKFVERSEDAKKTTTCVSPSEAQQKNNQCEVMMSFSYGKHETFWACLCCL